MLHPHLSEARAASCQETRVYSGLHKELIELPLTLLSRLTTGTSGGNGDELISDKSGGILVQVYFSLQNTERDIVFVTVAVHSPPFTSLRYMASLFPINEPFVPRI